MNYFLSTPVNIEGNKKLRKPQVEAYIKIKEFFSDENNKEALVVLPTGTGKSGLISISPFGVCHKRTLIITPGLVTKDSIRKTQEVLEDNFWVNFDIIFNGRDIPIVNEYSSDISDEHLHSSNIVYSNIQKISSSRKSGLLNKVPKDFFDFIIIDEAHHAPAQSWREAINYFNNAKILHVTGTPYRGDNQDIPGEKIHETSLSEVMRDKYVKWLRKETVNAHELYFFSPDLPETKLTKDEILLLKDKEWIEKSIALSEACSLDVITHSLKKLHELKKISPKVPHKILAIGCSIAHANDLYKWYTDQGIRSVILHSEMADDDLSTAFRIIEENECDVVISVNMLMEGYDHKYLTILAIFRPYRSINAFAQVVGRVLRAIPDKEITDFAIDNNAIVIFHEEIGLNEMWDIFQKEVERAQRNPVREYNFSEHEYSEKSNTLASIDSSTPFVSDQDSYLNEIDFNELFERKRKEISDNVSQKIEALTKTGILNEEQINRLKETLIEDEARNITNDIDPRLIELRPAIARKKLREILTNKIKEEASNILSDSQLNEKTSELYPIFGKYIINCKTSDANDGILVRYINTKLMRIHGPVSERDNKTLLKSIDAIPRIVEEIKRMMS